MESDRVIVQKKGLSSCRTFVQQVKSLFTYTFMQRSFLYKATCAWNIAYETFKHEVPDAAFKYSSDIRLLK